MGVITEISSQKNRKRVNVFVDNEFVSGLNFEVAVKNGLKSGMEIEDEKLKIIIEESEIQSAFMTGLDIISRSQKSKKEIFSKLKQKGYTVNVINYAIQKLEEYKYIDDESYANNFIKEYGFKSKREIEQKLLAKGVDKSIISNFLDAIPEENDEENAISYARKYMRSKDWNKKNKNNLFAGLIRKGFSLETAYKVIEILRLEIEHDRN